MKKILITGYKGQIGTLLIKKLLKEGFEVIGIDIQEIDKELLKKYKGKLELYKCDILNENHLKRIDLRDVIVFIPLAAIISNNKNIIATQKITECNVFTFTNIIPLIKGLRQIIFPSSMMVYGEPIKSPIDESHPTNPNTIYGMAKLYAENLLILHSSYHNICSSILRIAAVYGPGTYSGDRCHSSIPNFINAVKNKIDINLFGEIYNKRDYVHATDVVNAIYLSIKHPFDGIINIGSGKGITTNDLANLVVKISKSNSTILKRDLIISNKDYTLDISKAKELIGYKPKVSIEKGIKDEMQSMR